MPFTPYTSQTILPSANGVVDQQHASIQQQQQQQQPTSFFTRRPTAPSPVGSPPDVNPSLPPSPPSRFNTLLPSASNAASTSFTIDAVEAWGKTTLLVQHDTLYLPWDAYYQTPISISAHRMVVYCTLYSKNNPNPARCVYVLVMDTLVITDGDRHDIQQVPYASRLENKINLGFGRKSIERILVIPQVSKAVVLCGNDHVLG